MTNRAFDYAENIDGHYEIALGVENYAAVDKMSQEVVAKGGIPVIEPATMEWGQRTCYIVDPEGNLVEIGTFVE